jgi:hypothetical protein
MGYRKGERVTASLLRAGWIAFILVALALLRSAALSASLATPASLNPADLVGEWEAISSSVRGLGLKFSPDGSFQETMGGVPTRTGSYRVLDNEILVSNVQDGKGEPVDQWVNHAEARLEAIRLRADLKKDRLQVTNRHEDWWQIRNGAPAHPFILYDQVTYKRLNAPRPDRAKNGPNVGNE